MHEIKYKVEDGPEGYYGKVLYHINQPTRWRSFEWWGYTIGEKRIIRHDCADTAWSYSPPLKDKKCSRCGKKLEAFWINVLLMGCLNE